MSLGFFVKTIRAWWVGENTIQGTVRNERDGERARDGTEEERVRHVPPFLMLSSVAPLVPRFRLRATTIRQPVDT